MYCARARARACVCVCVCVCVSEHIYFQSNISAFSDKVFNNEDIIGMYTATVGVGLTVILCAISAGFSFFNTFGAYTSWLYGPPMLYVLALTSGC